MKKRFLEAARITKTVGLRGEMRAQLLCDGCRILTDFDLVLGKERSPVKVLSAVPLKNDMCKIRLEGIETAEQAQKLAGKILYLDREDADLPEDTWFIADIIGLPVYDAESGELYGEPIISTSQAVEHKVKLILVIARPGSCRVIAKRIGDLCMKHGIALIDIRGRDLCDLQEVNWR